MPGTASVWSHPSARASAIRTEAITAKEPLIMETRSTTLSTDAQAILESMGDAFYALDGEWRIVYANRRALAFWGVDVWEVIGRVIWERFPQLLGTVNEQVLRRVRAEQQVITFEAPSPTTGIWVSVNVGPTGDGVTDYWRDISERIEAEQALRSFAGDLEREVADRTRALSETVQELRQSRERYSAIFEHSPVDLAFWPSIRTAASSARMPIPPGRAIPATAASLWSASLWTRSSQPSRQTLRRCSTVGRSRPGSPWYECRHTIPNRGRIAPLLPGATHRDQRTCRARVAGFG